MASGDQHRASRRASMQSRILIGIGGMAAVDEIVFHRILGWHHFYDLATPMAGLLSDGLLHSAELIAIVAGIFMLSDLRRGGARARDRVLCTDHFPASAFRLISSSSCCSECWSTGFVK